MSYHNDPARWTEARQIEVGQLYDLLADKPKGLTAPEMADTLDWAVGKVKSRVHDLRLLLGDDTINVPCEKPEGPSSPWIYRLVGRPEDARLWVENRLEDTETRLHTIHSVTRTCVNATDARTVPGKRARKMEQAIRHLIEDLDLMSE